MLEMYNDNKPIDLLTLSEYLHSKGCNEQIGGSNYLTYLIEVCPTTANSKYYAGLVKKSSDLRKISQFSERLNLDIKNGKTDVNGATEQLNKFIDEFCILDNGLEIIRLSDEDLPESREWLLEGLIPMGFPSTLYAAGGIGKSYLAINLGISACMGGESFLGRDFYSEPLNVLYIDYELDKGEIIRRAKEVSHGLGLSDIPENFFYNSPDIRISKLINDLPAYIKHMNIEFIIIDSMGSAGLDALDEKSVIYVYSKLRNLGVTSLLVDHQSKLQSSLDNPDIKSPYGSVYKSNLSRSVIHLVIEGKIKNGFTVKLVQRKSNFGEACDEELIDFIFDKENEAVLIIESSSISQKKKDMLMIKDEICRMYTEGIESIQSDLVNKFKDSIARDKVRAYLLEGEGNHWRTMSGKLNNSKVYLPLGDTVV